MSFFNKVSQGATKLYNNAVGKNGIFNKVSTVGRKFDNSIARVGNFITPFADRLGAGDTVRNGVKMVHDWTQKGRQEINDAKNGLERAVKSPINDIQRQNYV